MLAVRREGNDGRRWLLRNPERKFGVIVSNNTYNWRANSTNLLSVEFLQLIRAHLKPGGVFFYNTTGSNEVQITGATVFPYGLRMDDFLALSDSPMQVDRERWRRIVMAYTIDGKRVFDAAQPGDMKTLNGILEYTNIVTEFRPDTMEDIATVRQRLQGRRLVTDDNMGTEWER